MMIHSMWHLIRPHCSSKPDRRRSSNRFLVEYRAELLELRTLLSDVLTYHNDLSRDGQDLTETVLAPQNVSQTTFGKLFTQPADGYVYAQPLYMANVPIPGEGTHNVVFVATEHDSVYAYDADSNAGANAQPLWHASFIDPANGITTVPEADLGTGGRDIVPEIGITGTPVIDPSTGTLYVVAKTKEVAGGNTSYVQRLHALDIHTGAEKFGGPVVIQPTAPGTGTGNDGQGNIPFNSRRQNQRAGLALYNGNIYIAFASHGDVEPYHGWLLGYSAQTLQLTTAFVATPSGEGAGIWQGAVAPSIDANGNMFVVTGDGTFTASAGGKDYGDSALRLTTAGGLSVADSFTPFNQQTLNGGDFDLGSTGALLLPDQAGAHLHVMVFAGKEGRIYGVDRDNLGEFHSGSDSQIIQSLPGVLAGGVFGGMVYFNNTVYIAANGDFIKAFSVASGLLSTTPTSQSLTQFNFPGAGMSISANGLSNGILWATQFGSPGILHAYDASNLCTSCTIPTRPELATSPQAR